MSLIDTGVILQPRDPRAVLCQQQRNSRPWLSTNPQGSTDVAGVCNRNVSKHGFHHFLRWLQAQDKRSFSSLTFNNSCSSLFLCINSCQLAPLQLKIDFLMISEHLGNGVWMDRSFPKDFPKREDSPLWPGLEHSHSHYQQLHKKSPYLYMLLFWRVRSWLYKYEFIHSTIFFFFKLICKSWIILSSW